MCASRGSTVGGQCVGAERGSAWYLLQTGGYQNADVPTGFLAVLDLRERTGPLHMGSCFGLVLDEPRLGQPRYIVTMLVPGNGAVPSPRVDRCRSPMRRSRSAAVGIREVPDAVGRRWTQPALVRA